MSRPRTSPRGAPELRKTSLKTKPVYFCPLQRGACTRLESRWGGMCRCRAWGRESTSDWQSADSRRINAGSVDAGHRGSETTTHTLFPPLSCSKEGQKNDWKTGFIAWVIFIGVMRFPNRCTSSSCSSILSTNPGGLLEDSKSLQQENTSTLKKTHLSFYFCVWFPTAHISTTRQCQCQLLQPVV